MEAGVAAVLERRLDPLSAAPVAFALSGGGDSLALLHLAAAWCARNGRPLVALTVDHGLNPDSAGWTAAAGEAAGRAGAAWRALAWQGPKPSTGLPAAARAARHRLLAGAAREAGAKVILTGHTLDDVMEGELMREADAPALGRLAEWSPSPAWPEGRGVFLLRPLLGLRRADLRDWLKARGLAWLDDPANDDPHFARTRARRLLPLREKATPDGSDEGSRPPFGKAAEQPSSVAFSRKGRREVAAALLCASGTDRPPRGEAVTRLLERLDTGEDFQATLAGARLVARAGKVQVGREAGRRGLATAALHPGVPVVWDGRYEITVDAPGWSVAPLGGRMARLPGDERRNLRSVPAWARPALPVLVGEGGEVRLPAPLGHGPATARSLAEQRLAAACGVIAREGEIDDSRHGAKGLLTLC